MYKLLGKIVVLCSMLCLTTGLKAENRTISDTLKQTIVDSTDIAYRIEALSKSIEALNRTIDITVTNVSIQEFVRAVANLSGLNINVATDLDFVVINNFTKVRVADLLIFLCKQYKLEITSVGNIVDLYRPQVAQRPLKGIVDYKQADDLLSIDFQNIPLGIVTRQITLETGKNVINQPDTKDRLINIYLQNLPFKSAMENLVKANNLEVEANDDGSYFIKDVLPKQPVNQAQQSYDSYGTTRNQSRQISKVNKSGNNDSYDLNIVKTSGSRISVNAVDAPIFEVIKDASKQCGVNYFISTELKDNITLSLQNVEYDDLLKGMFTGKDITFVKDGSTYIIGDRKLNDFKVSRIIKFNYRPVDSLLVVIPKEFTQDISLKEFSDLNSILASGSNERIRVFEDFCNQIDKLVPVIMIEVIIVDIQSTTTLETGLNAGFGQTPATTKGTVLSGVDLQLSTKAINSLIEGVGLANLGKVSNNFYLNIKALESLGALKVRSTPILSTLNGHEAKINIGETEYYLVKQSNVVAGQTQVVTETTNYSNVEAKLEVVIKPFVSGDDQITLNVKVTQSDFTKRISEFAPPGLVSRDFSSKIRVKNQDMVLLGGLEEKSTRESSRGIPLIQRIPIIKWFFSSRTKEKSDTKLNIFIRPTIIG